MTTPPHFRVRADCSVSERPYVVGDDELCFRLGEYFIYRRPLRYFLQHHALRLDINDRL